MGKRSRKPRARKAIDDDAPSPSAAHPTLQSADIDWAAIESEPLRWLCDELALEDSPLVRALTLPPGAAGQCLAAFALHRARTVYLGDADSEHADRCELLHNEFAKRPAYCMAAAELLSHFPTVSDELWTDRSALRPDGTTGESTAFYMLDLLAFVLGASLRDRPLMDSLCLRLMDLVAAALARLCAAGDAIVRAGTKPLIGAAAGFARAVVYIGPVWHRRGRAEGAARMSDALGANITSMHCTIFVQRLLRACDLDDSDIVDTLLMTYHGIYYGVAVGPQSETHDDLFAIFADDVAGEPLIRSLTHALLRLEPVSELSVVWAAAISLLGIHIKHWIGTFPLAKRLCSQLSQPRIRSTFTALEVVDNAVRIILAGSGLGLKRVELEDIAPCEKVARMLSACRAFIEKSRHVFEAHLLELVCRAIATGCSKALDQAAASRILTALVSVIADLNRFNPRVSPPDSLPIIRARAAPLLQPLSRHLRRAVTHPVSIPESGNAEIDAMIERLAIGEVCAEDGLRALGKAIGIDVLDGIDCARTHLDSSKAHTNEGGRPLQCATCRFSFWCSQACKNADATAHARICPLLTVADA